MRRDIVDITSLDRWEEIYIKKYQACNEAIGYNILPGTANGFGKINPIRLPGVVEKATQWLKDCRDNNLIAKRPNRKYTEDSKSEIGEKMRNVNIGRMHITNGIEDKFVIKVKKKDIPEGWWKGRSLTRGKPKKDIYVKKTISADID